MTTCTVLAIGAGYIGFVMFIGRFLSHKWHPDGGEPETEPVEEERWRR